jgi:hypothetical protein
VSIGLVERNTDGDCGKGIRVVSQLEFEGTPPSEPGRPDEAGHHPLIPSQLVLLLPPVLRDSQLLTI